MLLMCTAAVAGGLLYAKLVTSQQATAEALRAQRIVMLTEALEKAVVHQDAQLRAFLITAAPSDIPAFESAVADDGRASAELLSLLNRPQNLERIRTAARESARWRAQYAAPLIKAAQRGERLRAQQMMIAAGDKARIVHIVAPITEVRKSQMAYLELRTAVQQQAIGESFSTLVWGGVCLMGIAIGLSMLLSRQLTDPVSRMTDVMGRLAAGDNKIDVSGADRGDEIGAMAKAVVVFRDAAVALETVAAEKARRDAEQKLVVEDVAAGLGKLASGDLTAQLKDFPEAYKKVQDDFNEATEKLHGAMAKIARSTDCIHAGSREINQASDDLSRRTEQQAASLEETAAAMTEITAAVQNSAAGAGEANALVLATQAEAQESRQIAAR